MVSAVHLCFGDNSILGQLRYYSEGCSDHSRRATDRFAYLDRSSMCLNTWGCVFSCTIYRFHIHADAGMLRLLFE